MATETVEVEGHIIDSLLLPKILDAILAAGADYQILDVTIGRTNNDPSKAVLQIDAIDDDALEALIEELQVHGANRVGDRDASLVPCDQDGVLPAGFYSTTNLPTEVRIGGHWLPVANPEMDCGLVVTGEVVRTLPMHRATRGDQIVVGGDGVRVQAPRKLRGAAGTFEFMNSEVSSEKPKALLVAQVAERIKACRQRGGRVLAVCGPAVVHTGAAPDIARLVRDGWIDVLFAGNGFATHDIESNVLGTSLGVSVDAGLPVEHGHSNHLRVINEVRRWGSIEAAVHGDFITGGVMYECVKRPIPFVLGGSIRDDGPLPDVQRDVVAAADTMRENIAGVEVALMLASTLHGIATGNILPAGIETFCVDINHAVLTKLADRGSHQALGIVTDVGLFVRDLSARASVTPNSWGRRYLMCPPEHFGVLYEINPWMHREVAVDVDRAHAQWEALVTLVRDAGAEVEVIKPQEGWPDMVFTANAGIVNGRQFVPAHFRNPERQGETPIFASWFDEREYRIDHLPTELDHEGAGDALPFGGVLVSGYRWRSDAKAHGVLSSLIGAPVRSVELVDERYYHLDITFCPLDDRRAMVVPEAWDSYGQKVMRELVPEPLVLEPDEAAVFHANSIVVGTNMVMPACSPRVGRQLEAWGFDVAVADVSEFLKAGGGVRCLTLSLDVALHSPGSTRPAPM